VAEAAAASFSAIVDRFRQQTIEVGRLRLRRSSRPARVTALFAAARKRNLSGGLFFPWISQLAAIDVGKNNNVMEGAAFSNFLKLSDERTHEYEIPICRSLP